jgi:EAL domain-containing protein (putative c-di-GMP-specific phosphodiesterase class I)
MTNFDNFDGQFLSFSAAIRVGGEICGTDYSSLSRLHRFAFAQIKIDRSLSGE